MLGHIYIYIWGLRGEAIYVYIYIYIYISIWVYICIYIWALQLVPLDLTPEIYCLRHTIAHSERPSGRSCMLTFVRTLFHKRCWVVAPRTTICADPATYNVQQATATLGKNINQQTSRQNYFKHCPRVSSCLNM